MNGGSARDRIIIIGSSFLNIYLNIVGSMFSPFVFIFLEYDLVISGRISHSWVILLRPAVAFIGSFAPDATDWLAWDSSPTSLMTPR